MRVLSSLVLWMSVSGAIGCAGDQGPIKPKNNDDDDDDDTTGPIRDEEGSLVALSWQPSLNGPDAELVLLGMFVESRQNLINLAQCLGSAVSFCAEDLPDEPGEYVDVFAFDEQIVEDLDSREVGSTVTLGPWSSNYGFDSARDLGFYLGVDADNSMPTGPLGVTLGGDWGEYEGTDDISAPTAIAVSSPDPMDLVDFFDTTPIALQWEPGESGDIYLYVQAAEERRLYLLEDSGSFDLDLSALDLVEGDSVNLILGRWTRSTVDHDGHEVELQIQSNQPIHGIWRSIGEREPFEAIYDECAAAEGAPSALPGNYYGSIEDLSADLNPGVGGCTGAAATAADGVIPIDLYPQDQLTINYELTSDNASLYLLTDCTNTSTCLEGSDTEPAGDTESVIYLNETNSLLRVYAILDGVGASTGAYNLDIYIESLGSDILVPTCVDAIAQGPVESGLYSGSIGGHADLLDPSCAEPAGGGEGLTQVYLDPGQVLTASVEAPGGNPKLYLVYNCAIADSCFYEDDTAGGIEETLSYTNSTGLSEYFYLVLDAETNLSEYVIDIEIQ